MKPPFEVETPQPLLASTAYYEPDNYNGKLCILQVCADAVAPGTVVSHGCLRTWVVVDLVDDQWWMCALPQSYPPIPEQVPTALIASHRWYISGVLRSVEEVKRARLAMRER